MTSKAYQENYNLIKWGPDLVEPKKERAAPKRSDLPAPMIQSDTMEPLMHHGIGKILDSKSAFRKKTKELGLVEYGNETPKPPKLKKLSKEERKKDIAQAITQLGG